MLDPSLPFYGAVFGAVKRGAIAVPLFTLFGPDGVAARVEDCRPKLMLVEQDAPVEAALLNLPLPEEAPEDDVDYQEGQRDDQAVGERQAEDLREPHPLHDEEREDRVDERVHRLQALTGH